MPITLSTPLSKRPASYFAASFPRIHRNSHSFPVNYSLKPIKVKHLDKFESPHVFNKLRKKSLRGFLLDSRHIFSGFIVRAQNEIGISGDKAGDEEIEAGGQSSMPERFRYLTKEAPEKPVRWPWLIVVPFLLYCWRAVVWELLNWKNTATSVFRFLGYISKLVLALVFHFIGDPVTSFIRGVETVLSTIRAFYSSIISYAPIQELMTIIVLTSVVLAISEATVPDSVNSQPYLLSAVGIIGFAAVKNYISELFFWILLVCVFSFARLVRKRDYVSSTLPLAAVLAAVGEPWVRVIAMFSFLTLAILQHSKNDKEVKVGDDSVVTNKVPFPLVCAALAIGVRVMAKWAGYRHLTWMIV